MLDGYVEPTTVITMTFSGRRQGLVVLSREPSADTWENDIVPLLDFANNKPLKFIDIFVRQLESWNLRREDGTAVPATRDGLMSMNIRFVTAVLKAWINNGILVVEDEATAESLPPADDEDPFEAFDIRPIDMNELTVEEVSA